MIATATGLTAIAAGVAWFFARCTAVRARWKQPVTQ